MFGNLEMDGNRITGLSYDYPPVDSNDAVSWRQVGLRLDNYVPTSGSMITGMLGVGRSITIGNDAVKIYRRPIEDEDATNKGYVDFQIKNSAAITIWAVSRGSLVAGRKEWSFGGGGGDNIVNGYVMLATGSVTRAGLQVIDNSGNEIHILDPMVGLYVNDTLHTSIKTDINLFVGYPRLRLNIGDILSFKSLTTMQNVKAATVCLLIELDLRI
jgi:hypothetical protein